MKSKYWKRELSRSGAFRPQRPAKTQEERVTLTQQGEGETIRWFWKCRTKVCVTVGKHAHSLNTPTKMEPPVSEY